MHEENASTPCQGDQDMPIMVSVGGKRLELRIDITVMLELRKLSPPIDIRQLVTEDGTGGLYADMRRNPEIAVDIAFHGTQHNPDAITDPTEFARGLAGDALGELTNKVIEGVIRFIPDRQTRSAHQAIVDKVRAIESRMLRDATDQIGTIEVEKAVEEALATLEASSRARSTGGSTSSAGSSDSIHEDRTP